MMQGVTAQLRLKVLRSPLSSTAVKRIFQARIKTQITVSLCRYPAPGLLKADIVF